MHFPIRDMKVAAGTKILAGLVLTLMLGAGSAVAQMDPGSGAPVPKPTASPADTAGTPRASVRDKKADSSSKPTSDPITTGAGRPRTKVSTDSLTALREQIEGESDPQERVRLQLSLVEQLTSLGKKPEALTELRQMALEDRFDPPAFYNIGNALARLGDYEEAIVAYRKAIEQRKGRYSFALNNLGVILMRQGRWQEAGEAFNTALRLESFRYAEASYNLGRLYAAQGEIDLAIREWHRAVKVDPGHTAAAQAIAGASYEGRITVNTNSPDTKDSRSSASNESKRSSSNTNASAPVRSATSTRALTVDQVTYNQLQHAREARERGKQREAVDSYRSVLSRMGGYFPPANLELSYVLISMKQPDEALGYLRAVTARDPARYPISFYHMARIYEMKGELEFAAAAYEEAANRYRGVNPQFLLDVSRVREKRGDYKGALAAMEEYLKAAEKQGLKPEWSEQRLAVLRQKLAESQPK